MLSPFRTALALLVASAPLFNAAAADAIKVGAGSYLSELPPGAKHPDGAPRISAAVKKKVPTNDWWSSLAWTDKEMPQFPHPLAVQPKPQGLRIAYPGSKITANKSGIFGAMPGGGDDLILSLAGVEKFPAPVVDGWSDWFVTALFEDGAKKLRVSYGHGSPYVYATCEGASPRVVFSAAPMVWSGDAKSSVLGVRIGDRNYGFFAPTGATWKGIGTAIFEAETAKGYYSAAVLPDSTAETLALFAKHAHAHVTDTRVEWAYGEATQAVKSTFTFVTTPREGTEIGTVFALYPHQWRYTTTPLLAQIYGSVRGMMKVGVGNNFSTTMTFPGVLPWLPDTGAIPKDELSKLIIEQAARALPDKFGDTYWEGKHLGHISTASAIADATGLSDHGSALRERLKKRLEAWFTAVDSEGNPKSKGVFAYDSVWGTLIGYPASFGSDKELNDHHFHYGYFLKAAAEVARRDPAWASDPKWGTMLKALVRDIANPSRDDAQFPFMRAMDVYAGHSWASGHSRFGDGNNNESSSEAINAWAGIVLLGEAIGDKPLRDLGAWLLTTELSAIEDYWFGVHGDTFPQEYPASVVTMVWGGKGANATWFSADPEMVHGINWLPITGASLYLGRYPDYAKKNYAALVRENLADDIEKAEKAAARGSSKSRPAPPRGLYAGKLAPTDGTNWSAWADIIWMYRALTDPADALAQYQSAVEAEKAGGKFPLEAGNSRLALAHWIQTLNHLGQVDRTVTADTSLYAVFSRAGKRVHVAYNSTGKLRTVKFSDGVTITVQPGQWGLK